MRSETRKETSKSTLAARVRTLYAANLGWLEGFPLAGGEGCVRWISLLPHAPAREMRVEGSHLSRATYALNKLRGDLAPGLPRLADDPDAWISSAERRLELLKGAVHHGRPLPSDPFEDLGFPRASREQASRLAAAGPELRPLLRALAWIYAGDPSRSRAALDAAREWGHEFGLLSSRLGEQEGLVVLLRLLQLAADHGESRVRPLAACLLDPRAHDVATDRGYSTCGQVLMSLARKSKTPLPDRLPSATLGRELALWCEEIVQHNRPAQRRALRLFELASPLPLLERWALWWDGYRKLLREAQVLLATPNASRHLLRARVTEHQQAMPEALPEDVLIKALRRLTSEPGSRLAAPLLRILARIPEDAVDPGRTQLLVYWGSKGLYEGVPDARVLTLLAGFERYLGHGPFPEGLLQPWKESGDWTKWHVEDEMLDSERPRRAILAAYEHLSSLVSQRGGLERKTANRAVELFFQAGEPVLSARLLDSLIAGQHLDVYNTPRALDLALRLCRERPERFADVLKALAAQEREADLPPSEWPESVLGPLSSGGLGDFVRESIVTRQLARLLVCVTKSILLDAAGLRPLPQPHVGVVADSEWVQRYPPHLHEAIRRLAAVLDDPEPQVARLLASDFPDAGRLRQEIQAIESRLDRAAEDRKGMLLTRLGNLKTRLAEIESSSPLLQERGTGKGGTKALVRLDRAWGRAILDRWERELDSRVPDAIGRLLQVQVIEIPSWLAEPRNLLLLAAATRLQAGHRQLACELFRLRGGPPPWDLRDDPRNRSFAESLPRLDWKPWIDGVGTVAVTAPNGRRLHLALEDDPLEIFRMGAHFQTCLSPGCSNFFSVFTNAADINKRVLYARDDSGRILGRCLLALTAEGGLLRFESYCHDGNLGFEEICASFAEDLARRMGTQLVSRGKVPALVGSDWYDDGPVGADHRFPALEERSPFRSRLAAIRPGELLGELRRALKPARLDELTLPLVLVLPELKERPELAVPLLRPAAECRALPDELLVTAAWLGLQAGAADLVRRLFLRRLTELLRQAYRYPAGIDRRANEILLQLDPAGLLDLLRRSRPRHVRDWSDDYEGIRLESAAAALDALYRPRQAQEIWKRLANDPKVDASDDQRQRARTALG